MDNFEKDISEQKKEPWDKRLQSRIDRMNPYLTCLWKNRKMWVVLNTIGVAIIVLGLLIFANPYYDVSVDILPDYGSKISSAGSLSSLASLGGLSLKADPNEIYENIIKSESVLLPVICSKYLTNKFKDSVSLIEYFGIDQDESLPHSLSVRKQALKTLEKFGTGCLQTKVDFTTKILTVSIRMPESKLASDVVNRIVQSLDLYVRTQRKSFASNQREYLEERIKEVTDSLTMAEDRLRGFKEKNISSGSTPRLILEGTRLSRNVDLLQNIYMELTRQLELVKLDQIKDVPVLNIQELAGDPIIKTGPSRWKWAIGLIFVYLCIATIYILMSEKIQKAWTLIKTFIYQFRLSA